MTLCVYVALLIALFVVQNAAIRQPDHQTLEYSQALQLKNDVYYVTPMQERVYWLAQWGLMVGWTVGVACMIANGWIEARRKSSRQNQ